MNLDQITEVGILPLFFLIIKARLAWLLVDMLVVCVVSFPDWIKTAFQNVF
jgi:hypothetical protein